MRFDHDEFLPPFVKLSTSPYCTNISSQYDGTHYNENAQHGARYNSTERTTLPLPGESQRTHLSTDSSVAAKAANTDTYYVRIACDDTLLYFPYTTYTNLHVFRQIRSNRLLEKYQVRFSVQAHCW